MNFKRKQRKTDKPLTREEELLLKSESLRAENELLKKLTSLNPR
jgi:transposase